MDEIPTITFGGDEADDNYYVEVDGVWQSSDPVEFLELGGYLNRPVILKWVDR